MSTEFRGHPNEMMAWMAEICAKYEKEKNRCARERGTTLSSSWNHLIFAKILVIFVKTEMFNFYKAKIFAERRYLVSFIKIDTNLRLFLHWKPVLPADVDTRQPPFKGRRKTERKGRMVAILAVCGDSKKARASPKIYNQLLDRTGT